MEVFDSRYFVINKKLLKLTGLWPYDRAYEKFIKRICVVIIIFAMGLPHFIGIIVHKTENKRYLLEHIGAIMFIAVATVKIISSILSENKLKVLYTDIVVNWRIVMDKHEKQILEEYSEMGRIITIGYIAYMSLALITFVTVPLVPIVLDMISPLNASRQKLFIMNGEYLIDRETNYRKIYMLDISTCTIMVFIFVTCDSMYAACVEHCLGLFAIIRYRLRMPNKLIYREFTSKLEPEDPAYHWMLQIIRLHSNILKFTSTLESTYARQFFAIVAVNLVYTSLLCVLTLINSDIPLNFTRYVLLCLGAAIHLFYISWPGQKLINHSSELHQAAYLNEWYESSARTKGLLSFFLQRCSHPSLLTAGGLYIMNFENYLAVMKKSVSFMAVFSSFR